jgi:hypothetical protein
MSEWALRQNIAFGARIAQQEAHQRLRMLEQVQVWEARFAANPCQETARILARARQKAGYRYKGWIPAPENVTHPPAPPAPPTAY